MSLTLAAALALASQCAPSVAPETLLSIVHVESRFDPLAIGVNGVPHQVIAPQSVADAVAQAKALIGAGRSVDLGLAQINSKNLGWLGLSVEAAFEPCHNLAAAARVLQAGYDPRQAAAIGEQPTIQVALSRYNTGDAHRGFANGYVQRVIRAAAQIVPALQATLRPEDPGGAAPPMPPARRAWDVFGDASASTSLLVATPGGAAAAGGAQ